MFGISAGGYGLDKDMFSGAHFPSAVTGEMGGPGGNVVLFEILGLFLSASSAERTHTR